MRSENVRVVAIASVWLASTVALPFVRGEIARGSRLPATAFAVLLCFSLPVASLLSELLLRQVARHDPLRRNHARFRPSFELTLSAGALFVAGLQLVLLLTLLGGATRVGRIPAVLLGLALIVVGNAFPRVRPNLVVGVRTPWTLGDEQCWAETHRLGGYLLMALGALLLGCAIWAPAVMGRVASVGALTAAAALVLISYFRRRAKHAGAALTVCLALASAGPGGAAERPDFSGHWLLSTARSRLATPGILRGAVSIAHREPLFALSRSFFSRKGADEVRYELTTDGAERTTTDGGTTRRSRLLWVRDQLVLDETISLGKRTATNVVRYQLKDGGMTLVARESFRGPVLRYDNVWVFERARAAP